MLSIADADPDGNDARILLGELGNALAAITGSDGTASFDAADVRGARACFVLAYARAGAPAGCGALRPLQDTVAELKRMYARPGSGAGRVLLAALERRAIAFGYTQLWLETRRINTRAVAFYRRHGFRPIPHYGKYVGRADAVCLGKSLADVPAPTAGISYKMPASLPILRRQTQMSDVQTWIKDTVTNTPVVLFMKGTAQFPQCGFSSRAIQILKACGVDNIATVNVLDDAEVRQGIKDYSNWPTVPQLYVNGEFVGGSDIMTEMYESGELQAMFKKDA